MKQGHTNSAACRIAGINRKTGNRWRFGRTVTTEAGQLHYPPIAVSEPDGSGRFLSDLERIAIADGLRAGRTHRKIAVELGRHPTTVSREVARNSDAVSGEYRPFAAHHQALARRARPKQRRTDSNEELCRVVQQRLDKRWSPEQIAAWLIAEYPDRDDMRLCHETIYQAIYAPTSRLRRDDRPVLRTGRLHRRRRRNGARVERFTEPMVNVSERPDSAADRVEPGHWEGDLIIGSYNRSAIGTLVERTTRTTMLVHFAGGRRSEELRDEMTKIFEQLPASLRRSLTWDQGIEMARHHEFSQTTGIAVYFCDRASPWQRPTNENTNGLLRDYFPKGTDLSVHTPADLAAVARELNERPRKTLGWTTPADLFASLLQQAALQ
jgi:IS30 family transposase